MRTRLIQRIALLLVTLSTFFLPPELSAQSPASLSIGTGCRWVMNGPVFLVLNNMGFTNNGSFVADSSHVLFTGDPGVTAAIGGSSSSSFYHLTLHNAAQGRLMLNQTITVAGELGMQVGNLVLNGHVIVLGGNGRIVGESNLSSIIDPSPGTGYILAVRKLIAPQSVNPGNIGIELTSNANLGTVLVLRRFNSLSLANGVTSITRWFSIIPYTNTGLNATVRFHYLDSELGVNSNTALDVWTGSDLTAGWLDKGNTAADTAQHWVQLDGIDHFNRVALGSSTIGAMLASHSPIGASRSAVKVQAYPNPSHGQVVLSVTSTLEKDVSIGLYDQAGHLLQRRVVHLNPGPNVFLWNLIGYTPGIYYLGPEGREFQQMKVIKQ